MTELTAHSTMISPRTIRIPLPDHPYDIVVGNAFFANKAAPPLQPIVEGRQCLVITDSNVGPIYLETAITMLSDAGASQVSAATLAAGEASKNHAALPALYSEAVKAGLDRESVIVALGGGVVGDTAGFVAATYMRGIRLVQIPTSLVALVDSSVGGKTGVDLPEGKNLVGAFHQPKLVLADVATLATLDRRQLCCGLAEVVKYGVILDAPFFAWLEERVSALLAGDPVVYRHVVERCCELKAQIVLEDERDKGRRALLNYGHTFGHALEALSGYQRYTHGEAIAIGMAMAADLAVKLDATPARTELVARQGALFSALELPQTTDGYDAETILATMRNDKKYVGGQSRLILPDCIGTVKVVPGVPDPVVLETILGRLCSPNRESK